MFTDHKSQGLIEKFIQDELLDEKFYFDCQAHYLPLAEKTFSSCNGQDTFVLGINGAQGTGKSTLAKLIESLAKIKDLSCLVLSIDDLYRTQAERQRLAQDIHPLLASRGVPGTHDMALGQRLIDEIKKEPASRIGLQIPRFNKAIDDRFSHRDPMPEQKIDLLILEGWCLSVLPQSNEALAHVCNSLEEQEDPDAIWRHYINDEIKNTYKSFFAHIDYLVMLKAPNFEKVFSWRCEQEEKLRQSLIERNEDYSQVMSPTAIKHFVAHYERLTRWMLKEMPSRCDCLISLNEHHRINSSEYR